MPNSPDSTKNREAAAMSPESSQGSPLSGAVRSLDDRELCLLLTALLREWRDRADLHDSLLRREHL